MEKITDSMVPLLFVLFLMGATGFGRRQHPGESIRPNWWLLGAFTLASTLLIVVRSNMSQ